VPFFSGFFYAITSQRGRSAAPARRSGVKAAPHHLLQRIIKGCPFEVGFECDPELY
jgi:hypothetical protein